MACLPPGCDTTAVQEKDPATPQIIFLIGYRATGKSTVGRLVASRLGADFLDTDQAIEARIGMTIAELFEKEGEPRFRDLEGEALEAVAKVEKPTVVGTGGGMIIRPAHADRMRELGRVIWLSATAATIRARLAGDESTATSRPSLTGASAIDEVDAVLTERTPIYRKASEIEVPVDPPRTPDEIADEVVDWLGKNT